MSLQQPHHPALMERTIFKRIGIILTQATFIKQRAVLQESTIGNNFAATWSPTSTPAFWPKDCWSGRSTDTRKVQQMIGTHYHSRDNALFWRCDLFLLAVIIRVGKISWLLMLTGSSYASPITWSLSSPNCHVNRRVIGGGVLSLSRIVIWLSQSDHGYSCLWI